MSIELGAYLTAERTRMFGYQLARGSTAVKEHRGTECAAQGESQARGLPNSGPTTALIPSGQFVSEASTQSFH